MSNYFKVKQITNFKDGYKVGDIIPESDYSLFTSDDQFVQFELIREDNKLQPYEVVPGIYTVAKTMAGYSLKSAEFNNENVMDEYVQTQSINDKIDRFFNRIDIFKKLRGNEVPKRGFLLYGLPGCHAKGTKILMHNGSTKSVENIKVGDFLMGPDSKPREVLKLVRGEDDMVKISPIKGDAFVVNMGHILSLMPSGENSLNFNVNISVSDYLKQTKVFHDRFKLYRTGVDFESKDQPIPAYIMGAWLGDGSSTAPAITSLDNELIKEWSEYGASIGLKTNVFHNATSDASLYYLSAGSSSPSGEKEGRNPFVKNLKELEVWDNKHIPNNYLTGDRTQRLELLAGLLDTDGHLSYGGCFDFISKYDHIANDVAFITRSLGLAAYVTECKKGYDGFEGTYYRVSISGDVSIIPCRITRKKASVRKQVKNVLRTGFTTEVLPKDEFFGFTVDNDHLYVMGDFTVTHNCGKSQSISKICKRYANSNDTCVLIWHTDKFDPNEIKSFIKSFEYKGVDKFILVAEDIGGTEIDEVKMRSDSSLLSLLDNVEKTFTIPTIVLATTNHPEVFLGNLTNRPQRFDQCVEVKPPAAELRAKFLEFFANEYVTVTEENKAKIVNKKYDDFSIAHIKECVTRAALEDASIDAMIDEVASEIARFKKQFQDKRKLGMGFGED
jgi:hypothetical protein